MHQLSALSAPHLRLVCLLRPARKLAAGLVLACTAACGAAADAQAEAEGSAVPQASDVATSSGSTQTSATSASPNGTESRLSFVTTDGNRDAGPAVSAGASGLYRTDLRGCVLGEYFADVTVGGSQSFSMLIDSGSTTAAIASQSCSSCGKVDRYNTASGRADGRKIGQAYGDGSYWYATIYADAMHFGTPQSAASPAVDVAFGAITQQGNNFFDGIGPCSGTQGADFDGILGMGPDGALQTGTTSLMTQLFRGGQLAHDAFALTTCDVGGALTVGGYAPALTTEDPVYAAQIVNKSYQGVPYDDYYTVQLVGVAVGGKSLALSASKLGPTLVDNGTNFTQLSTSLYEAIAQAVAKDPNFTANFSSLYQNTRTAYEKSAQGKTRAELDAVLPALALSFAAPDGSVSTVQMEATRSYLMPLRLDASGINYYAATLVDAQEEGPAVGNRILGNSLLRQHTVVFDRANARVGFAGSTGCAQSVPDFQD